MKQLNELLDSLPDLYYKDEEPYWLNIRKVLRIWNISYIDDKNAILFWTRSRNLQKACTDILTKIRRYNKIK